MVILHLQIGDGIAIKISAWSSEPPSSLKFYGPEYGCGRGSNLAASDHNYLETFSYFMFRSTVILISIVALGRNMS